MRTYLICVLLAATATSPGQAQQAETGQKAEQASPQAPSGAQSPGAVELPSVKIIQATPEAPKKRPAVATKHSNATTANNAASTAQAAATLQKEIALNAARENILTKTGANSYGVSRQDIEALPQGDNAPLDKVLLQTPGVYQDTATNGGFHIRDEHGNVQYRINGIQLPDGVQGFGQVLETGLIGNMAVLTGALPAQYGLHTAGVVDIQTRAATAEPSGEFGVYGGSHGTISSNIQYGGVSGDTTYFLTGRWLQNGLGIENPTSSPNAIHDETQQEKFFSYVSKELPDNARLTMMTGAFVGHYQIPDNPGQPVQYWTPTVSNFNSASLNEQQLEQNYFGVLAFQQSTAFADYQLSYFTRYSSLHYTPDQTGDLMFNGISTDVTRTSFLNGIQADSAFRIAPDHTLRAGLVVTGEQTNITNNALVFLSGTCGPAINQVQKCDGSTPTGVAAPMQVTDQENKLGWIAGVYVQDEWRITDKLTLNSGLRFDQMWQYVDANQFSPRIAAVYKPITGTELHAGYARYFTPPSQIVGAPENYAIFNNTVAAAQVPIGGPSLPERSHYFDAGVTQVIAPGFEAGLDAYYKITQDLIDDGQFGQAYTLTSFNYAKGENEGLELKLKYAKEGVLVYGNLTIARQVATQIVSNQYLISASDYTYILSNYIPTDHDQRLTASAGISYPVWDHTRASVDMIYGSGLRAGDYNSLTMPPYTQVNLGLSHEFVLPDWKPLTVRFDVVNLFDQAYELRDGSGIGIFAPQWGPRRGFFLGLSQKF